jgi:Kae1-associated kinase Bud32
MRGAEAVLCRKTLLGAGAVVKSRIPKTYRLRELDERLRAERTRSEARLLHKAKLAGVKCPTVLEVWDFDITMSFIEGERPAMAPADARDAGEALAKLHSADIIHGDFTPANLIRGGDALWVIDFGLGFVSNDIEDRAVDVFTMMRSLESAASKEAFLEGYKAYPKAGSVLGRVKEVEKRVRYAF